MLHERGQSRRPDGPISDEARHQCSVRRKAKLVRDQTDEPGSLGGVTHGLGLRDVERERFLAEHVHAGGQGLERDERVRVGRRGDRDRIELERQRFAQSGARNRHVEPLSSASFCLRPGATKATRRSLAAAQRWNVHTTAESGTDDRDARHQNNDRTCAASATAWPTGSSSGHP